MTSRILNRQALEPAFDVARRLVESDELPCAVMAVGNSDGLIGLEAFGGTIGVTVDSVFALASISKPIAAVSVMQLVQAGELLLGAPVAETIVEFEPPGVTAWHLLTHTSGLEAEMSFDDTRDGTLPSAADYLRRACSSALSWEPGTRVEYKTISFAVLGEMVARRSGIAFGEWQHRRLWEPLGMRDTGYDPAHAAGRAVELPVGSAPIEPDVLRRWWAALKPPGVGLWSTAGDLAVLGMALLDDARNGTGRVLSPAFVELMTCDHTAGLRRQVDGKPRPAHYGLAWRKGGLDLRGTLPGSSRVFEHDGAWGSQLWIDPEYDLVYVLLTYRGGPWAMRPLAAVYGALK